MRSHDHCVVAELKLGCAGATELRVRRQECLGERMPTTTADLNQHPECCDAFHEAGHAVIGVFRGLHLSSVTGADAVHTPPHCVWDLSEFDALLPNREQPGVEAQIEEFTERYAEMCLASCYSEKSVCDAGSDEQAEALHCDYLDAERIRYCYVGNYLGRTRVNELHGRSRALVAQHAQAIARVAERLLAGETLSHEQVHAVIVELGGG